MATEPTGARGARSVGQSWTRPHERALAPDLARGGMLLLIVLAHAPLWLVGPEPGVSTHPEGGGVIDEAYRTVSVLLIDSRAYPLFAALFGYGLARVVDRQRAVGTPEGGIRRLLRRRGWWLILFGLVHALLVTPVEILGAYGLAALLIGWLLFRSQHAVRNGIVALALFYTVIVVLADATIGSMEDLGAFEFGLLGYSINDLVVRVVAWFGAVFGNVVMLPVPLAMLVGAWAGRQRLLEEPGRHRGLLLRMAVVGIPVSVVGGFPLALVGVVGVVDGVPLAPLISLHTLTGLAGGLGYAALFGLAGDRWQGRRSGALWLLTATGRRSLTCYLLQSALLVVLLSQTFLGVGAHVHSAGAALVAVAAWSGGVATAAVLERAGRPGPADALLRRLAYR
ncbi:DUF418 domain-containing protein [Egibacter rhizosphaerae]|uniref:DUF418 domain-containing protein n=1 Tax=Egibacter rhizosphaerae TaxID=1670831 RepID=A0A411YJD8_9ACTN|nr:DUF418 domain-containing protein [Egibacter rhizosphaerae]QBI21317.1 DUF418 domain-containing protein [Egibacter rhizosphaerae]